MSSRMILPGVAGATLILTLFFAVVAGAQETTAQTAAPETTSTASAAQETTTADNNNSNNGRNNADAFRCEFFLRQVSDEGGTLRHPYRGDELIVQRFEQCLSGDVLRNTIPNRRLPFTGGMSLVGLAAIGLVFVVVGVALLRAVIRRAG